MPTTHPAGDSAAASQALRRLRSAVQAGRLEQVESLAGVLAASIRTVAAAPGGWSPRELGALQKELRDLIDMAQARRGALADRILATRKNRQGAAAYQDAKPH